MIELQNDRRRPYGMLEIVDGRAALYEAIEATAGGVRSGDACTVMLSGNGPTAALAASLCEGLRGIMQGGLLHMRASGMYARDCEALAERVTACNADLLVAIGGGRIIDTAKSICARTDVRLVVIPTALSSDGLCSPISVLSQPGGGKVRESGAAPVAVVIDTEITRRAPLLFAVSGMCDLLSNASAQLDLADGHRPGAKRIDGVAAALATAAYRAVCGLRPVDLCAHEGQRLLAQALYLSGYAMHVAGNSTPCSGAEHTISHAIDGLLATSLPHGLQVGVCTLYCHHLRQRAGYTPLPPEVYRSLLGLGEFLSQAIYEVKDRFVEVVLSSRGARPDRTGILDLVNEPAAFASAFDDTVADLIKSD
ncbi:putative sn-glycerol-1-phosphate dehydrogenase [Cupriavidus taiwanensis]|uniref:iron-containing alcohol dehydrogenase n=1 Tax=Cupriavidus taiwanensis TaxID=164546 RepID=UPI000E11596F|nr:iron-containing alcohol dehydrogenase [Cupriavidus taiwanensis]SOY83424.1 putative sn-glycerol-1-phosphate dehydrogenase [Cupriavidus taiwanensis]SOY84879.1 putative sn-glycerol-1-phosphate dehydrogenase [Cupriavidus taiwanensis]